MSKGVVMYHIGRSGSTVLCDLLSQNPAIGWEVEPFEHLYSRSWRGKKHQLMGKILNASPRLGLQLKRQSCGSEWFGFDVKFYHWRDLGLSVEDSLRLVQKAGYEKVILLMRRNFLRKVVSSVVALERGAYHSRQQGYGKGIRKVTIELDGVLIDGDRVPLLDRLEGWQRNFDELERLSIGRDALALHYEEDIMNDPGVAYQRVCRFLGVPPAEVGSELKRTNPYPLSDLVENWDELCAYLKGTPWSWMVKDSNES